MTTNVDRNLATIQGLYEAFGRGDIPGILETIADDVDWEAWADNRAQAAGVPWLQRKAGKEGVLSFFQVIGAEFDVKEFAVLDLAAGGSKVYANIIMDATIRSTGKHFRDEELHVWTLNDAGKITGLRHYIDTAKHMDAATK